MLTLIREKKKIKGWFYETMTSNILNNKGKTEVYRRQVNGLLSSRHRSVTMCDGFTRHDIKHVKQ